MINRQYIKFLINVSQPFQFKKFTIQQELNAQKVGTDSMLLGAWTSGNFNSILDIGTGTGILALMLAQKNLAAKIVAIEPDEASLNEAKRNFENSSFANQIEGVQSTLQHFTTTKKFDLIIANPPYFEESTLSKNENKNRARHTAALSMKDLYFFSSQLVATNGKFNLVFPFDLEAQHFKIAAQHNLFPHDILRTTREDGERVRTLVSYSQQKIKPMEVELVVKYSNNSYSKEYIDLTKDFYFKNLT